MAQRFNQEAAAEIWYGMTVAQRYAIMERVPYQKSQIKRLRACLALIAQEA